MYISPNTRLTLCMENDQVCSTNEKLINPSIRLLMFEYFSWFAYNLWSFSCICDITVETCDSRKYTYIWRLYLFFNMRIRMGIHLMHICVNAVNYASSDVCIIDATLFSARTHSLYLEQWTRMHTIWINPNIHSSNKSSFLALCKPKNFKILITTTANAFFRLKL